MAIVDSEIVEQLDLGDKWQIREHHTDSQGEVYEWRYHPGKSVDLDACLAAHATALAMQLARREVKKILDNA
jgi:hypothetical protein